jgi:hypothetical protein
MKGFLAGLALTLLSAGFAWGAGYEDPATSAWFKTLSAPRNGYVFLCCDQADCRQAASDWRIDANGEGEWWAHSNRVDVWIPIPPKFITRDDKGNVVYSIFPKAILCEGDPVDAISGATSHGADAMPRLYCFAPPPLGF